MKMARHLKWNSSVICRATKPKARKGKILFINAVNEVTRERAQSFLTDDHIERIVKVYAQFKGEPGLARVSTLEEIRAKDGNLSIPLYVAPVASNGGSDTNPATGKPDLTATLNGWLESSPAVRQTLKSLGIFEKP
jgi:type I restriction enzyme M protein